jgi:hypothetical protein
LELKKKLYNFDVSGKINAKNVKTLVVENSTLVPNLKIKVEHLLLTSAKLSAEYKLKQITGSANFDTAKGAGEIAVVGQQAGLAVGVAQPFGGKAANPLFKAQYNAESFEVGASV